MLDKMKNILGKVSADYADLRYETKILTMIRLKNKEISDVRKNASGGFVLRVLKNGGFATVAFNDYADADFAVKNAMKNVRLFANKSGKKVEFAKAPVVKDSVKLELNEDPRSISFEEKLELIKNYNDILLAPEKVIASNLWYAELNREKRFINSEGSEIQEDLLTTRLGGIATSSDGEHNQEISATGGGSDGFHSVRNLEEYIESRAKLAVEVLDAKPAKGGVYNCILDPALTGVFTHEAFGHFSEADLVENSPSLRKKMKIGNKLGSDILNITDNAVLPNQLGHYKYDDEGVAVRKVELMKNGVLTGRLHSRRTAAEFREPVSGHMIAEDYRYAPIIRMGTIFIEPGKRNMDDLLQALGDGMYLCGSKGGQTMGENFTFGAIYGYTVKNGKIKEMIRDLNISGNLYKTLADIKMIADDLVLSKIGGCGKRQMNPRSCHGGPHILANNLVVGGI